MFSLSPLEHPEISIHATNESVQTNLVRANEKKKKLYISNI